MIKIGEKLKNLRLKNNLTQAELANRCELSKGFISLLESDQTSPSLSTLEDILISLGTNFKDFFNEDLAPKVVYTDADIFVKEFEENGYQIQWLVSDSQKNDMEPIILTLEGGARTDWDAPHAGEEFGYLLSGNLTLCLGQATYKVKKGECFYFAADEPHCVMNKGKTQAKLLWITTPPNF